MAAHKHWRLYFGVNTGGTNRYVLGDVELRVNSAGANLCTLANGTTSAAEDESGLNGARAFDGGIVTGTSTWAGGLGYVSSAWCWVGFSFFTARDIGRVSVRNSNGAGDVAFRPTSAVLKYSDDGARWVPWINLGTLPTTNSTTTAVDFTSAPAEVKTLAVAPWGITVSASGPSGTPGSTRQLSHLARVRDFEFGGFGVVEGHTLEFIDEDNSAPVARKVRLHRDRDSLLARETWSRASDGYYRFEYLDMTSTYTALAYDHTGDFRAVVADRVTPEPLL